MLCRRARQHTPSQTPTLPLSSAAPETEAFGCLTHLTRRQLRILLTVRTLFQTAQPRWRRCVKDGLCIDFASLTLPCLHQSCARVMGGGLLSLVSPSLDVCVCSTPTDERRIQVLFFFLVAFASDRCKATLRRAPQPQVHCSEGCVAWYKSTWTTA